MKVKAIKDHSNDIGVRDGGSYEKKVGSVYEITDEVLAQHLIDDGVVEKAGGDGKARGS